MDNNNNNNFERDHNKTIAVYFSCKTMDQLATAVNFGGLLQKKYKERKSLSTSLHILYTTCESRINLINS